MPVQRPVHVRGGVSTRLIFDREFLSFSPRLGNIQHDCDPASAYGPRLMIGTGCKSASTPEKRKILVHSTPAHSSRGQACLRSFRKISYIKLARIVHASAAVDQSAYPTRRALHQSHIELSAPSKQATADGVSSGIITTFRWPAALQAQSVSVTGAARASRRNVSASGASGQVVLLPAISLNMQRALLLAHAVQAAHSHKGMRSASSVPWPCMAIACCTQYQSTRTLEP